MITVDLARHETANLVSEEWEYRAKWLCAHITEQYEPYEFNDFGRGACAIYRNVDRPFNRARHKHTLDAALRKIRRELSQRDRRVAEALIWNRKRESIPQLAQRFRMSPIDFELRIKNIIHCLDPEGVTQRPYEQQRTRHAFEGERFCTVCNHLKGVPDPLCVPLLPLRPYTRFMSFCGRERQLIIPLKRLRKTPYGEFTREEQRLLQQSCRYAYYGRNPEDD